jgi:2-oxo-4-hydroxy-4-carboxy-5-ureidoimidazoline decarboxylase
MTLARWLDGLPHARAAEVLQRCCGSRRWVEGMLAARPFGSDEAVLAVADRVWSEAGPDDVREALTHHPEIGADLAALRERFAATASWSAGEQGGVHGADEATLVALRDGNLRYRERFGHTFVVCATGKHADEMLALLRERIANDPVTELRIAAAEQGKITRLRLAKLREEAANA